MSEWIPGQLWFIIEKNINKVTTKAFDSLNWNFLFKTLKHVNLAQTS